MITHLPDLGCDEEIACQVLAKPLNKAINTNYLHRPTLAFWDNMHRMLYMFQQTLQLPSSG
jgi:hypothetical protein